MEHLITYCDSIIDIEMYFKIELAEDNKCKLYIREEVAGSTEEHLFESLTHAADFIRDYKKKLEQLIECSNKLGF